MIRLKFLIILLLFCPLLARSQGIRVYYGFERKQSLKDTKYSAYMDMRTDYDGSTAVFYSEKAFVKDSLRQFAFDKNGNSLDNEAYSKLVSLPGGMKEVSLIDFKSNTVVNGYMPASIIIRGSGRLESSAWSLTEETGELDGYKTKKAVGEYYGRKWTIWYAEEIPYNVGPWLFWGAPGLIVKAEDEDKIFSFYMIYVEELSSKSRYDFINACYDASSSLYGRGYKKYNLDLKDAEKMYTKIMNDMDYLNDLIGINKISVKGDLNQVRAKFKYIPLIPESYWK